jgi:aspartate racemase
MKCIGMIGGMSWESTVTYYRLANEQVRSRLGGLHSARLLLHSVDFHEIEHFQTHDEWDRAGQLLADAALGLQRAGADFLVLCANTMHKVADSIEQRCSIPLLHIVDAATAEIKRQGIHTIGLLGTRYTMEQAFYVDRLRQRHGLQVLIPDQAARASIHQIIYDELCLGKIEPASREVFRRIIADLVDGGAQGIVLGCTEIAMLVGPQDSPVHLFDTTELHVRAAVDLALAPN